jgi:hypothetical protein
MYLVKHEEGMSIAKRMYAFAAHQPMSKLKTWIEMGLPGYCFNSDHVLLYFVNFYHITAPEGTLETLPTTHKQTSKFNYRKSIGDNECNNKKARCSTQAEFVITCRRNEWMICINNCSSKQLQRQDQRRDSSIDKGSKDDGDRGDDDDDFCCALSPDSSHLRSVTIQKFVCIISPLCLIIATVPTSCTGTQLRPSLKI